MSYDEIFRVRLCYSRHKRHCMAHEVIAGPGYRQMLIALWIKITVRLRVRRDEKLSVHSPILLRENKRKLVPMTAQFMAGYG